LLNFADSNVNDCTGVTSGEFIEDKNFRGPFYFATAVDTVNPEQGLTTFYADPGTCFNVRTPTANSVFEPASYKHCVAENYVLNYRLPGVNNAQP
jgi:hypothetical protein